MEGVKTTACYGWFTTLTSVTHWNRFLKSGKGGETRSALSLIGTYFQDNRLT